MIYSYLIKMLTLELFRKYNQGLSPISFSSLLANGTKSTYTKADGTTVSVTKSPVFETTANKPSSVFFNANIGRQESLTGLPFYNADRKGTDEHKAIVAECQASGDYGKLQNFLTVNARSNEQRTKWNKMSNALAGETVKVQIVNEEFVDADGVAHNYTNVIMEDVVSLKLSASAPVDVDALLA
jgi:hypothetical protein